MNTLNIKQVKNKVYDYSCLGGSLAKTNIPNKLHPESFDINYMLEEKYLDVFNENEKISIARVLAYKCCSSNVVALYNDLVDYFVITDYTTEWYWGALGPCALMYDLYKNVDNYFNVYYPVRHESIKDYFFWSDYDGKWIEVSFSNDVFVTTDIGPDWKL